jgi:hypothetical protein
MWKEIRDFLLLALLAGFYFAATYFMFAAVAPDIPRLALHAAFWTAGLAIAVYPGPVFCAAGGGTNKDYDNFNCHAVQLYFGRGFMVAALVAA